MMNNVYPVFLKPVQYEEIEKALPELPPEPEAPPKPKLIKKNWLEKLILQCDEYEDMQINQRRMNKYYERLAKYHQDLSHYKTRINNILSKTNIDIYRNKQRELTLLHTESAITSHRDVLKGRYEAMFKGHLNSLFNDKIKTNVEFLLPNGNGFVPDFAYVNRETGLCIDIEIDEPYALADNTPIHCIGDDDFRDEYFLSKGWFVIRFAEIQIAQASDKCAQYVESAIKHILSGEPFINSLVPEIKKWSYNESRLMAYQDFRNTY